MSVRRLALCFALVVLSMLAMSSTASAQSLFVLSGSAREDVDPDDDQTPINQVVSINNTSSFGAISRTFGPTSQLKVKDFDNMLQLKYYFQPGKFCSGGSPRFQLRIDPDGASGPKPPANAFGYIGDSAFGTACSTIPPNQWRFEDMTNSQPKWDASQLGGGQTMTWDQLEVFAQTTHPNHGVVSAHVVEDQIPFPTGCTWYDNVTIRFNTLDDHSDTAGVAGTCTPAPPPPPPS